MLSRQKFKNKLLFLCYSFKSKQKLWGEKPVKLKGILLGILTKIYKYSVETYMAFHLKMDASFCFLYTDHSMQILNWCKMNLQAIKMMCFGEGCLNVLYYMSNLEYSSRLIEDRRDIVGIFDWPAYVEYLIFCYFLKCLYLGVVFAAVRRRQRNQDSVNAVDDHISRNCP